MPKTSIPQNIGSNAVLVSVNPEGGEAGSSRAELAALARVLGVRVTHYVSQRRSGRAGPKFLGEGKLAELSRLTGQDQPSPEAALNSDAALDVLDEQPVSITPQPTLDCVLVDANLTPAQQRTLEQATGLPVYDRTQIVLHVFDRHAQTRQAKLQVELAWRMHELPRLRDDISKAGREGGGGRGERGHRNVVLEKQESRARMTELRQELSRIQRSVAQQRAKRGGVPEVALVGYTNVGKSTLLQALTGSEVLVRDEPFATLGTTVRRLAKNPGRTILVSDTVGFMQGLPHELVASFHATLEAARHADLLLIVADASNPRWADQLQIAEETLAQVGAADVPRTYVLNKVDRVSAEVLEQYQATLPDAVWISAHQASDVQRLREHIQRRCAAPSLGEGATGRGSALGATLSDTV